MIKTHKTALTSLILVLILLYTWNFININNEWLNTLGTSLAPVIVALVSSKWMYNAYRVQRGRERYVGLLFSIALIIHAIGNLIWFLGTAANQFLKAPESSYAFWLTAYFLFLAALLYKILIIKPIMSNSYLFNTIIFLIVITAMFFHYSVAPFLASTEHLFDFIVIGTLYPLADIGLLFVSTLLYFLLRHRPERTVILYFMAAFYLQILGDLLAVIMKTNKDYYQLLIEPIWVVSLLCIGYAGVFAKKYPKLESDDGNKDKESFFPYIGVVILAIIAYRNNDWDVDALNIALAIIFFMIISRQFVIISQNKKLLLNYRELAYHDSLTGLLNRASFQKDLEKAIRNAKRENSSFYVLLIDLDRFKMVNDTLGHIIGDHVLVKSAQALKDSLNEECCIYRLGGDEFVVLLQETTHENYKVVAKQIIENFNETLLIEGHEITITPSIGISSYPYNGEDSLSLFKAADTAMYLAKGKGRNNYQLFNDKINEVLTRKMMIENELRRAIQRDELELVYQPKFDLIANNIIGMEALLRWNSKELGFVSPAEFIPVAEDSGLIVSIGEWVMKTAFLQNKEWQNKGYPALRVSVNVSVQQFKNSNIVKTVAKCLLETGLEPQYVELEITESIMQNIEESTKVLTELRKIGIKIALDDFGKGYSSLHVLKSLPIDTLKIDKAFIDDIKIDKDHSLVKGIIDIATNLNLKIVAEGVEHEYQVKALVAYNCPYGQGYYFAKPLSVTQFEKLFVKQLEKIV